ncbi:MAG: anaerobic ribonucleoside-triphosphate reductase activating protein [Ruminococcus sp.]|jgi:anaerobic ribonucleoside-triphosphate reductase activating protein|nr:anaerobic ribonucleoside-triphosphate reductase activating protein [Ruminococcus sp.]
MENTLRISGLSNDSIVDGPGLRFVIFTQGCDMHCEGCHNPSTWDKNGGYLITFEEVLSKIAANPLLDGVTLSGGEPFLQARSLAELVRMFPKNLNIICYTGFTYEYLIENANKENGYKELLSVTDTLIDGEFIESEKDYNLDFKGSRNQRSIDVKASMENKKIILL